MTLYTYKGIIMLENIVLRIMGIGEITERNGCGRSVFFPMLKGQGYYYGLWQEKATIRGYFS